MKTINSLYSGKEEKKENKIENILRGEEMKNVLMKDSVLGTINPGFKIKVLYDTWKVFCIEKAMEKGSLGVYLLSGTVMLEKRGSTNQSVTEWKLQVKVFESDIPSREHSLYTSGSINKYASHLSPKMLISFHSRLENQIWIISEHFNDHYAEINWNKEIFSRCAVNAAILSSHFLKDPSQMHTFQEKFPYSTTSEEFYFLTQHIKNFDWDEVEKSDIAASVFPKKVSDGFKKVSANFDFYMEYCKRLPHSLAHGNYNRLCISIQNLKKTSTSDLNNGVTPFTMAVNNFRSLCVRPIGYDLAHLLTFVNINEYEVKNTLTFTQYVDGLVETYVDALGDVKVDKLKELVWMGLTFTLLIRVLCNIRGWVQYPSYQFEAWRKFVPSCANMEDQKILLIAREHSLWALRTLLEKQKFDIIPKDKQREITFKDYEGIDEECKLFLRNLNFNKDKKMDLESYRNKMKEVCNVQHLMFTKYKCYSVKKEIKPQNTKIRIDRPENHDPKVPLPVHVWFCDWLYSDFGLNGCTKRYMVNECNCIVITIIHRNAPESTEEQIIDECVDGLVCISENCSEFGGDPNRLVLMGVGQSANIALGVSLKLRQTKELHLVNLLVLVSPVVSCSFDTKSWQKFGNGDFSISKKQVEWFYENYSSSPEKRLSPLLSPLNASDFSSFPPVVLVTAGFDPLYDHCLLLQQKLIKSNVNVQAHHFPDLIHGFFENFFTPNSREKAHQKVAELINKNIK